MIVAFVIWSIVAAVFLGIGISCRKSKEAVGFFTFIKAPIVEEVEHYKFSLIYSYNFGDNDLDNYNYDYIFED